MLLVTHLHLCTIHTLLIHSALLCPTMLCRTGTDHWSDPIHYPQSLSIQTLCFQGQPRSHSWTSAGNTGQYLNSLVMGTPQMRSSWMDGQWLDEVVNTSILLPIEERAPYSQPFCDIPAPFLITIDSLPAISHSPQFGLIKAFLFFLYDNPKTLASSLPALVHALVLLPCTFPYSPSISLRH